MLKALPISVITFRISRQPTEAVSSLLGYDTVQLGM
jgi:hypothetical protein